MATTDIRRVQKMTSKGQITLPSKWRAEVGTQHVVVKTKGTMLTVAPARFEEDEDDANWTTIFDKDRDNDGKGVPASEFIRILKKLVKEDEQKRKASKKAKSKR
jgi:bifunctional DNA-binding transcriptional regulator/antitoxin component of YhaV-PrlF toxin-antitoxin module